MNRAIKRRLWTIVRPACRSCRRVAAIPVPPGLQIEQIDPPGIDLTWEDRITRDVPVEEVQRELLRQGASLRRNLPACSGKRDIEPAARRLNSAG